MTEVHKERNDFEKMKKEDLISECLKLNKLLLQLKDENAFLRQQNNKMVDNLIDKVNEKTSNQNHDNNKIQQQQQQTKTFIQSLYRDQQRHLFFRIVQTKKYKQKIWAQVQLYTPILQQKFKTDQIL